MKAKWPGGLATATLLNMGIRITVVVIVTACLSYLHITNNLEQQTLDKLQKYITERALKESSIFILAQDNHRLFSESFLELWPMRRDVPAEPRFSQLFESNADGTTHLVQDAFNGIPRQHITDNSYMGESRWISGFVGLDTPVQDNQFQNRLLLAYDLVDRFAEGWANRFANTYVSFPEGVNIVYWPHLNWAQGATAELDIPSEEWVYIANKENNPARESVWTGLYYDRTADEWMVSCETPVDGPDGQHLINVGHDILLNDVFQRVFDDHLEGAHNFIVRQDGRLIAHPHFVDAIEESEGLLNIQDVDSESLQHQYQAIMQSIRAHGDKPHIIDENRYSNSFLAVAPIAGPDWFFVTVYPKALLSTPAKHAAEFIFMLGVISLVVELIMLYLVLRKKVTRPLQRLETASSLVSQGEYHGLKEVLDKNLKLQHDDEMGKLSRAFIHMAHRIHHYSQTLEDKIKVRTQELELARNAAEELARTDPLTGLGNRRAFFELGDYALENARRNNLECSDVSIFSKISMTIMDMRSATKCFSL